MLVKVGVALIAAWAPLSAASTDFFENKIRPLLANQCMACHGESALGGLRLDSREAILKGGATGPAVVPGDAEKSLLMQAVRHAGPLKMPKGSKLAKAEIDALAEWVKDGAVWPAAKVAPAEYSITAERRAFWSFQPLSKPVAPKVNDVGWVKTEIDRFVLARLEKEGLKPVRPASRRALLRRTSLDLTGLPPTAEEISAFEKDTSRDAFAKVVDRLLASPRYGERWGRAWLDVARYGEDDYRSLDPKGRGLNPYPFAYLYRDWVIRAFNEDLPYDQFVKAQLAADVMEDPARTKMLPALGFLGLGPWFYDNGSVEVTRADERNDRVDVVSRGFLGLTVACARCHDHKYDPVSAKDYYALAGVFANAVYHQFPQVPKAVEEEYKRKEKQVEHKEKLLEDFTADEQRHLTASLVLQASKYMQAMWRVLGEPKDKLPKVVHDAKLDYELAVRWAAFLGKPPKFYPYLTKWQEMIAKGGSAEEAKSIGDEFQALLLDVLREQAEVKEENDIIKAKATEGTKKKKKSNLPNEFLTNDDFCPNCGLELKSLQVEKGMLAIDVFDRDLGEGFDPSQVFDDTAKPGLMAFSGWGLERQLNAERRAYMETLRTEIEAARKELGPPLPYVHGVKEAEKTVNLRVNLRGSPFNLGDEVPRRFVAVLEQDSKFAQGSGRMELAEAILRQPLAMRVIANRVWKAHFGTGIVDSPSNLGFAGERASHPELLDYLANRFVDGGLSIKKLHREILLSAAYQSSSDSAAANAEKDPANRLYWRVDRHRLDAEQIRDAMLAASGALDLKMGGPSVELGAGGVRRTVYGKVSRYRLDEYLQLFDFPSPNLSAEKRFSTSVPLQRLFLMNSEFVQQQAELLARRVVGEPDQKARIRKAYALAYGREPTDAEVQAGIAYLESEPLKGYEERREAKATAKPEVKKPAPPLVPGAEPKEEVKLLPVTTWGRYAKVLLSASEFLFVE